MLSGEVEAATPYAAWKLLAAQNQALRPGDLLETIPADGDPGQLQIAKYVGFEPAQWYAPEPKSQPDAALPEIAASPGSHSL